MGAMTYDELVAPEYQLDLQQLEPKWHELFERLRGVENIQAKFVEQRFFRFRQAPKSYVGEFRKSADGAVSLAYTDPRKAMVVHVGESYAYYRKDDEDVAAIPNMSSQRESLGLFPVLVGMRFEVLAQLYDLYGNYDTEDGWMLVLQQKDEAEVDYRRIGLTGTARTVLEIELQKSPKQRIQISLSEVEFPAGFDDQERSLYFFKP